jgi:hypothetical protein
MVECLLDSQDIVGSIPSLPTRRKQMSGTVEDFDGLCGIIANFASSDLQLRCSYEMGHQGPCSFEKHKHFFRIFGGCGREDYESWRLNKEDDDGIKRGFIESVIEKK